MFQMQLALVSQCYLILLAQCLRWVAVDGDDEMVEAVVPSIPYY